MGLDVVTLGMAKADAARWYAPAAVGKERVKPAGFALTRLPFFKVYRTAPKRFLTDLDVQALRPPAGVKYYVSPTGSAVADGLTPATRTTVTNAVTKADIGTLSYLPGEYFRNTHSLPGAVAKSINYLAEGPGVKVTGWENPTGLTWTLQAGSIYQCTRAATQLVADTRFAQRTTWGDYPIYAKMANLAAIVAPGQWAIVGSTVYVWALAGSNLITDSSFMRLSVTSLNGVQVCGDHVAYAEGIDFEGTGTASDGPVSATTVGSVDVIPPRVIAVDCTTKYTPYCGFTLFGALWGIYVRCAATSIGLDGFNYHKNTLNAADQRPEFLEIDCVAHHTGLTTATENGNGSSAHESCKGVRVNGDYHDTYGPVVVDVDGSYSWNLGCDAHDSTAVTNSWAWGCAGPGAAPAMWLDECTGYGALIGLISNTGAAVKVYGFTTYGCPTDVVRSDTATIGRYLP